MFAGIHFELVGFRCMFFAELKSFETKAVPND